MPGSEPVAIVGAGLVGSLLSIFLAKRGLQVELFERRPDLRREVVDGHRSINLAVSTRGLHALAAVGLRERTLAQAIPMRGRMVHPGELQPYGKDDSQCIYSISRAGLNALLLDAAEATGQVKVHFKHRLEGAEPKEGLLEFESPQGKRSLGYARIFGADGSASTLRSAMAAVSGIKPSESLLQAGYKELVIAPEKSAGLDPHALHIWPRGSFMLIALPNQDRSYTCTLFLDSEGDKESFKALESPAALRSFFETYFAEVTPRIPDLEQQFFAHPTGRMVTIKTAPWNTGDRSLLIGDAAHAIVPFFGQGMNCGFEDCVLLDEGIGRVLEGKETWTQLFSRFGRERKPDSDAIADMAVENFTEMRELVADPVFLLEKQVERILTRNFPDLYVSRYALVTFSQVPYSRAYAAGIAQAKILKELCRGLKRPEDVDLKRARELIKRAAAGVLPELARS